MRLASKVTLALLASVAVVHLGSATFRIEREEALFEEDIARDSRVLGRALGHAVRRAWVTHGEQEALDLIDDATDRESQVRIRWVWLDAEAEPRHRPMVELPRLARLHESATELSLRHAADDELSTLYTYVPVVVPGTRNGALEVEEQLGEEQRYVRQSVINSVIATVATFVLCAGVGWLLGFALIGRRVQRLVARARGVGQGDLESRLVLSGNDELSELALEMDKMCVELKRASGRIVRERERSQRALMELRHADRLKSAGTLAAGVAHELGTPINVIEGYAQLIREDQASTARSHDNAAMIIEQSRRMAQIIRQLLEFTRRGNAVRTSTDARDVLEKSLQLVHPMVRERGVETSIQTGDEPALVNIGSSQLQQVLTNLLINGMQAMKGGGMLSVSLEREAVPEKRKNGGVGKYLSIRVSDTGEGMDNETVERIFEPFFTTKDVGEGTGLGLSVAHGIVEDHGGWIDVATSPGQGASFTVFLPAGAAV